MRSKISNTWIFFKSCCKIVKPLINHNDKYEGIKFITCPSNNSKARNERKHNFEYKEEKYWIEFEKEKIMSNNNIIKREINIIE